MPKRVGEKASMKRMGDVSGAPMLVLDALRTASCSGPAKMDLGYTIGGRIRLEHVTPPRFGSGSIRLSDAEKKNTVVSR